MATTVGFECWLAYDLDATQAAAAPGVSNFADQKVPLVKDATIGNTADDISQKSIGSKWDIGRPGMRGIEVSFEMIRDMTDTCWAALKAAWLAQEYVWFLILDASVANGGNGIIAPFYIEEFGDGDNGGVMTTNVKLMLAPGTVTAVEDGAAVA